MFHTGLHDDYHRPSDDADLIDHVGMRRVVRLMFGTLCDLANQVEVTGCRQAARHESSATRGQLLRRVPRLVDRLGAGWQEEATPGKGVHLTRVVVGSPAHKAQLQPGDHILRFAGREIRTSDDLTSAVRTADQRASVVVQRPGRDEKLELTVELEGQPMRLGITWRTDDAEPGTIILTHVVPQSPAAAAGLKSGDRIYQVAGRDFPDDTEFAKRVRAISGPTPLLIERDGHLQTVIVRITAGPKAVRPAA